MSLEKEFEQNINLKVLLLALFKKENIESFKQSIEALENSKVFTKKEGKKYLKQLRALGFVTDKTLTLKGVQTALEIEKEFKI